MRKYIASIAVKNVNLNLKAAFNFASKPNILGLVWEQHAGSSSQFLPLSIRTQHTQIPNAKLNCSSVHDEHIHQ